MIYDYTKSELESVCFNPDLFKRRLKKAAKNLLPYELDLLQNWLSYFTKNKPELEQCLTEINIKKEEGVC